MQASRARPHGSAVASFLVIIMLAAGIPWAPSGAAAAEERGGEAPETVTHELAAGRVGESLPRSSHTTEQARAQAHRAPSVSFEENRGQTDPSVLFLARTPGVTLFFTSDEIVMVVAPPRLTIDSTQSFDPDRLLDVLTSPPGDDESIPASVGGVPENVADKAWPAGRAGVVRMKFAGSNASPTVTATDELPGITNYFIGNDPSKWATGVPSFARIVYHDVYPGIDVAYYGSADGRLEYDLIVAPGVDPDIIRWTIAGAQPSLTGAGRLSLETDAGVVEFEAPVLYQVIAGVKSFVDGRFTLDHEGIIQFDVAEYDVLETLVIDPVLAYSTYLGGSNEDAGYVIAVDESGNAYITGYTSSTNFPVLNPSQSTSAGGADAFVTKLTSTGQFMYSTYLGGPLDDVGRGIAVDVDGNAYVTGSTSDQEGPWDWAFVAKLTSTGQLAYSTYLGGPGGGEEHWVQGIAVDVDGNAYITGSVLVWPTTDNNAFVAKFTSTGQLVYSTHFGGSSSDGGDGIAMDADGNAYITGYTESTDFPTLYAQQSTNAGSSDAFVTKLTSTGQLAYSTYLGGSSYDSGHGIAVDADGNAYITGYTQSTNFPTLNAQQSTNAGGYDAFVTKLTSTGQLAYSTYLGGSSGDSGHGIAVDADGNAYITGYTQSTNFPTLNAQQNTNPGSSNAFVTKLAAASSPPVPSIVTTSSPTGGNVIPGTSASDTATVSGSGPTPTGSITFFLCQPAEVTTGGCEASAGSQIGGPITLSDGAATSDTTTDTTTLGKYCWRVEYSGDASYAATHHTNSDSACFTVQTPPSAPRELAASAGPDAGKISLSWEAPISDGASLITTYSVYRSTQEAGPFDLRAEVGTALTYTDSISTGTWSYRVTATNVVGEGPPSNVDSATVAGAPQTTPGRPQDFRAHQGSLPHSILLTWRAPQQGVTDAPIDHYNLYRWKDLVATIPSTGPLEYDDGGVTDRQFTVYELSAVTLTGVEGPVASTDFVSGGKTLYYLMHGICSSEAMWSSYDPATEKQGTGYGIATSLRATPRSVVEAITYAPWPGATPDDLIEIHKERLKSLVEREHSGITRVVLVGHSMGGLLARGLFDTPLGDPTAVRIDRVVTLDSPDRGINSWAEGWTHLACSSEWEDYNNLYLERVPLFGPPSWMGSLSTNAKIVRLLYSICADSRDTPGGGTSILDAASPTLSCDQDDPSHTRGALATGDAHLTGAIRLNWAASRHATDDTWARNAHRSGCSFKDIDGAPESVARDLLRFDPDDTVFNPFTRMHDVVGTRLFTDAAVHYAVNGNAPWQTPPTAYDVSACTSGVAAPGE